MVDYTIKNIDEKLFEKIKKRAEEQGRSINKQIKQELKEIR